LITVVGVSPTIAPIIPVGGTPTREKELCRFCLETSCCFTALSYFFFVQNAFAAKRAGCSFLFAQIDEGDSANQRKDFVIELKKNQKKSRRMIYSPFAAQLILANVHGKLCI
jgi:hypothetical protein